MSEKSMYFFENARQLFFELNIQVKDAIKNNK